MSNQCVVDREQQAKALVLLQQAILVGSGGLVSERGIDGESHLGDGLLHETQIGIAEGTLPLTAEADRPIALPSRGHGNHIEGTDAAFAQQTNRRGKPGFVIQVLEQQGLLMLPNPACWGILDGQFQGEGNRHGSGGLQKAHAHDILVRVVQDKVQKLELDHL